LKKTYIREQSIIVSVIFMKKLFVLFIFGIFALVLSAPVLAQAQATNNATGENILETRAGTLPDSPFYGLKRFGEGIQTFFTFDQVEKAKLKYKLAQLRLAEVDAMARLDKTQLAENALKDYEAELNETANDEKKLSAEGRNTTELADIVGNNTYRHILVLQKVYNKVPDSAKTAIRKVIEKSMEKHEKISERIAGNNTVNITITIGNETVTREVPAAFAKKFMEMAGEVRDKTGEELEMEDSEDLKEKIAENTGIAKEKVLKEISDAKKKLAKIESLNLTGANRQTLDSIIGEAKAYLNNSEILFNQEKYGEAYRRALIAEKMLNVAKKVYENSENNNSGEEGNRENNGEEALIDKEKSQEQIDDAVSQITEAEQKLASVNASHPAANKLLNQAREHLGKAEQAFNNTKYGEAFGQATAAEMLARNAERMITIKVKCTEIKCIRDPCPGEHISDSAGCVNCASPCRKVSQNKTGACIQVITPAISPEGICKEFPTPCDVPESWEKVEKCPINYTNNTTVIKSQTEVIKTSSKCPGSALDIISSKATSTGLQIVVQNVGPYILSNFKVIGKKADNTLYENTAAAATTSIPVNSSAIITLPDITSSTGCPFSTLRVSAASCPGVSIEIDNSSRNIC